MRRGALRYTAADRQNRPDPPVGERRNIKNKYKGGWLDIGSPLAHVGDRFIIEAPAAVAAAQHDAAETLAEGKPLTTLR